MVSFSHHSDEKASLFWTPADDYYAPIEYTLTQRGKIMEKAIVVDVEKAIADAKAARDAYLAELFSAMFAKIKSALTSKKTDKLVAAH